MVLSSVYPAVLAHLRSADLIKNHFMSGVSVLSPEDRQICLSTESSNVLEGGRGRTL